MADDAASHLRYIQYESDKENEYVSAMRQLISKDLSEPYNIYVYRYFLYQWGDLCYMAMDGKDNLIGVVISKLEPHRGGPLRGYIAMLAVREEYRGQGIATTLVVLETETSNTAAMKLYERLGFLRSKRLHRYYLNGNSAFRLVLYLKEVWASFDRVDPYRCIRMDCPPKKEGNSQGHHTSYAKPQIPRLFNLAYSKDVNAVIPS
ncbi:conserved hypothetical protein [Histoplasma mississippiense (nom. inval.)]|uniref:conserved hypothetical protein n=1 Tax=Ajellomyces capsulatus (strain NAm1 / WU24) TaxID=2059318 RepID=UPI000157C8D6|nr:conserved hypothetical protein [Histoplasma mississippiense (nom. inval.)]EDN08971.1 conserved hypothetical protein [Histoplasma mississippiense (nom. inval.)]